MSEGGEGVLIQSNSTETHQDAPSQPQPAQASVNPQVQNIKATTLEDLVAELDSKQLPQQDTSAPKSSSVTSITQNPNFHPEPTEELDTALNQEGVDEGPQDTIALSQQTSLVANSQKPRLHPNTEKMFGSDVVLEAPKKYDDPEQQKKQDARTFSKSTPEGRESRSKAAAEIRKIRKTRDEISSEKLRIRQEGENMSSQITQNQNTAQELQASLEQARARLTSIEGNIIRRRLNSHEAEELRAQIPQLERQIQDNQLAERILHRELEENKGKHDRYRDPNIAMRRNAGIILDRFYVTQDSKIEQVKKRDELEHYLDEEGHVEDLAQMGLYVVHGIIPGVAGWSSPHLSGEWQDKLATVVDLKPTLSTSTITRGKKANLWYPFGVVFRSGRVDDVSVTDAGTGSGSLKDRRAAAPHVTSVGSYKGNISRYNETYHNEVILGGDPETAGLFISLDDELALTDGTDDYSIGEEKQRRAIGLISKTENILKFSDIFSEAARYGMRVFVFKNGIAHSATLDEAGRIVLGDEVTPQDMIKENPQIPEENRAGIHEQAVASLPPQVLQAAA
jgi:hypothetical protein